MKRFLMLVLVLALVVEGVGCVTKSTNTEGDREVLHQTGGAIDVAAEKMEAARAELPEEGQAWTMLGVGLAALKDARLNMAQQLEVHGPPKEPKPYSPAASREAREKSTKEHESGGWILPVAAGIAGVGLTLLGMPGLSRLFPVLTGSVGKIAQAGLETILAVRKKAEANGGSIDVRDVLDTAKEKNVLAGVQGIVKARVDRLEERLGTDFKIKLAPEAATPPAISPTSATT